MAYDPNGGASNEALRIAEEHGFFPSHTGGGCFAFERSEDVLDAAGCMVGQHVWMVTYMDAVIDGDPNDPQWIVGRYWYEEETGDFVSSDLTGNDGLTLRQACERSATLRNPLLDDPAVAINAATKLAIDAAANAIARAIQLRLGVATGDLAAQFFSDAGRIGSPLHDAIMRVAQEYCEEEIREQVAG